MAKSNDVTISAKVPGKLRAAIQSKADAARRTFSEQVRIALEEHAARK